jgi:hypothetical protein
MQSKPVLVLLAAVLATACSASPTEEKRYIRGAGMPIVKLPAGTVAFKRDTDDPLAAKRYLREPGMPIINVPDGTVALRRDADDLTATKRYVWLPEMPTLNVPDIGASPKRSVDRTGGAKRYVLEPGMSPIKVPPGTVALKRSEGKKTSTSRPLKLTVEPGKFDRKARSMPLELPASELASMPVDVAEKYTKRENDLSTAQLNEPLPTHVIVKTALTPTFEAESSKRYIIEGTEGYTQPTAVGHSDVHPMMEERADEMLVGLKERPILPRDEPYHVNVHPLT